MGELFSGPGGLAYGALKARSRDNRFKIQHVWATDIDPIACDTFRINICPSVPDSVIHEDVRELDTSTLPAIDALSFGFPCNDFSLVGERRGIDGNYGLLYSYGVEILESHQPLWFLAENVGGLRSANNGKALTTIFRNFEQAGYSIYPHLYRFEQYGIPQARHRIIIVGIRKDLGLPFFPPSTEPYQHIDNSCRNALENPPIPHNALNQEPTNHSPIVIERLKHIRPGENAFNAHLPPELRLNVEGAKISQIYKRLDPDKPAYSVTGSGGGGTHIYHYHEHRALTNRERARLQTFPDDFFFRGTKEQVRKQIGMAVPCAGAKIIFEAILNTFANIAYPHVECNI